MRQHWLEQQEAQPTPRIRQNLRRVTAEVTSDDGASLKGKRFDSLKAPHHTCRNSGFTLTSHLFPELQLNGSVLHSIKPETLMRESPTSPTSAPGPQNPPKCLSPHHQPSPPTGLPSRHTLPRRRRAPSLTRVQPSLSNSCGNAPVFLKYPSCFSDF